MIKTQNELRVEQLEVERCHKYIKAMVVGAMEDAVGIPVLMFCLETELHRMKGIVLENSYAALVEKDNGGMYQ